MANPAEMACALLLVLCLKHDNGLSVLAGFSVIPQSSSAKACCGGTKMQREAVLSRILFLLLPCHLKFLQYGIKLLACNTSSDATNISILSNTDFLSSCKRGWNVHRIKVGSIN